MISSRFQIVVSPQLMKSPAMLTKAPRILANAPATVMMSWKVSDVSVSTILRGTARTSPIRPSSAPWNHAQARAMALPFLMFSQISSWPISFMKPPRRFSALRGTGSPVTGSSPRIARNKS